MSLAANLRRLVEPGRGPLLLSPAEAQARLERIRAEKARRKLHEFVRQAWEIVEPAMPLMDNWHVGAICEHLEAVARGEIQKLLINIPPGHAKSLLVCVFWPAWVWTWRPEWRSFFTAYADTLATRDASRARFLMESPWYQRNFVHDPVSGARLWDWRKDQNRAEDYANTRSGRRISGSVSGKATGERGDAVVVDDPINAIDATSKAERNRVIHWWGNTMSSRLNDKRTGSFVVIMQRLHEEDLSGDLLTKQRGLDPGAVDFTGYQHLCLPSLFEERRKTVTYIRKRDPQTGARTVSKFWEDPRKAEGDLLFPELYPREVLDQARQPNELGEAGFAGQHQQRPAPADGLYFKKKDWRFFRYDDGKPLPPRLARPPGCNEIEARIIESEAWFDQIVISLDAAFKDSDENDSVSFVVIGLKGADRFVIDNRTGKMSFTRTLAVFRELAAKYPRARRKFVEDKANGSAVIDTLKSEISGIKAVTPEGGKEARAAAIQGDVESGNVYLLDGASWLDSFIEETANFPKGKHDDQVDALSQGLIAMRAGSDYARLLAMAQM